MLNANPVRAVFRRVLERTDVHTQRASCGSRPNLAMRTAYPPPLSSVYPAVLLSPDPEDQCVPASEGNGRKIEI
jgi:hypothetical protein